MSRTVLPGLLVMVWSLAAVACRATKSGDLPAGRVLEDGQPVEVRFEGNHGFSSARLSEVVAPDFDVPRPRSALRASVDDAAYSTENFYRSKGYPACRVDYEIESESAQSVVAVLRITEGPRVRIVDVHFEGNASISSKELRSFVLLPGRWFLPDPPQWYVINEVEGSRAAIEAYYRVQGFLDAEVELVDPKPPDDDWPSQLELLMRVKEGARYTLRTCELVGGVPEIDAHLDLRANLGRAVSPRLPGFLRSEVRELYAKYGYPDAEVQIDERTLDPAGFMDLRLAVQPGTLVTIGEVRIEGQKRTRIDRIRGNLALHTGERYDVRKLRRTFDNLYGLGVFSTVGVDLEGEGPERAVLVRLSEAPARELYFEPGYGSYEQLRMVLGWRERNLAGTARQLDIEGKVSQKAQQVKVGLTDPRFLESDTSANLTVFGGTREEPSFDRAELGSLLTFTRRLHRYFNLGLGYQYRFSQVTADDFTDPAVQSALGDVNISSLIVTPNWDARDSAFYPTQGSQARVSVEYAAEALGSQIDFLRTRWHVAQYFTDHAGLVLGLSWRAGLIAPLAATDVIPVQERFFNGGENTVRSFSENELGPKDSSGNPIGGEAYNVFTAEVRAPIAGRFESALFYDVGNVVPQVGDYFDFEDMRSAIGVGLRYDLPVGPVRLDLGWNPDPRPEEASYTLHFSVGFSF
jgi:outer membrane protein insertion porin family